MNKHTKLLVTILSSVILILATAIAHFYWNVSKSSFEVSNKANSITEIKKNSAGDSIFTERTELFGLMDSTNRVIIDAEWDSLDFFRSDYLIAAKNVNQQLLVGVLDLEGNTIVPFLYSDIRSITDHLVVATIAEDKGYVFYSQQFDMLTQQTWERYQVKNDTITTVYEEDVFYFDLQDPRTLTGIKLFRNKNSNEQLSLSAEGEDALLLTIPEWEYYIDLVAQFVSSLKNNLLDRYHSELPDFLHDYAYLRMNQTVTVSYDNHFFSTVTAVFKNKTNSELKTVPITISINRNSQNQLIITDVLFNK